MKTAIELCREEFPDFDELPEVIEKAHAAGLIECTAWNQDLCPSFCATGTNGEIGALYLYVDWLDEAKRAEEMRDGDEPHPRFSVFSVDVEEDKPLPYTGNDAAAALAVLLGTNK